ncbi:GNAT family N-acetyltransferase [Paenibacillus sp. J2TS4]|uniref:GNAT family N-acetyltransferase n=1 Tax=Paenibacillus sp. J2TS4 TaxID=2807194 RepID=UPI001B088080|nr:GNAT family N-acetyltransferase [Paenibacillus sp. J2TS4]GIP32583.1 putative N-acetyltransferase YobR [Paenibacillus sp. J2TS4]
MQEQDRSLIAFIEELAANTWPPIVQQSYGPWILRAAEGVTRRANSVWTCGEMPVQRSWVDDIESFYRQRGLPVCYHISPASPAELDYLLESKQYDKEMVTTVMIATTEEVKTSLNDSVNELTVGYSAPTAEWIDDFIAFEQFSETRKPVYEKIFTGIRPRHRFVSVKNKDNKTIGVGTAVVERGWAGFTNVVISPAYRRQGAGRCLIRCLTKWSEQNGASRLYLQVAANNKPALALYAQAGYQPLYQYHYRILRS